MAPLRQLGYEFKNITTSPAPDPIVDEYKQAHAELLTAFRLFAAAVHSCDDTIVTSPYFMELLCIILQPIQHEFHIFIQQLYAQPSINMVAPLDTMHAWLGAHYNHTAPVTMSVVLPEMRLMTSNLGVGTEEILSITII